jgi:hypothetical protein
MQGDARAATYFLKVPPVYILFEFRKRSWPLLSLSLPVVDGGALAVLRLGFTGRLWFHGTRRSFGGILTKGKP